MPIFTLTNLLLLKKAKLCLGPQPLQFPQNFREDRPLEVFYQDPSQTGNIPSPGKGVVMGYGEVQ